ncbi:MAG: flagellar basal body rod protein FlgB [Phycisphaerae bacterium]|nr:flagellar basal body rod protein FlgB [Phycisphaerae bacterium]
MVGNTSIVNVLEAGLRGSLLRQKVIANNLANLNTSGYRRQAVRFEDALAKLIETSGRPNAEDLAKIEGEVYRPMNTPVNRQGNDVDVDVEIGELMKSATQHKAYLRLLNKVYKQMESAMEGV